MVQMLGASGMGSRRRYLAEQAVLMEELFGKAEGFTTPITKPAASFKAPSTGQGGPKKPKVAALKPTGNTLPSPTARLSALKQNMVGQTGPSTGAPAVAAGAVGKQLRRKGKFQRLKPSTVAKSFIGGVAKPISRMSAAERQQVRAGVALDRRFRPTQPLHRRGAPAEHNAGNKSLRELAQMTRGGEKSSNPNITFGPSISAADRERVLRIAPRKLKGGKVHVDHYPDQRSVIEQIMGGSEPEGYVAGGSRRVPAALHLKRGTGDHTIAHELTHANRKSLNAHRLGNVVGDSKKLGREEGRADAGAARAGFKRGDTGRGHWDYEQFGSLKGASRRNLTYRWAQRKMGMNIHPFDMDEYNKVRSRMNAPVPRKLQPSNRRMVREGAARAVVSHPATPVAVGVAALPFAVRDQRRQEAERKAKSSAAYKARKARKQGVTKALKVKIIPEVKEMPSFRGHARPGSAFEYMRARNAKPRTIRMPKTRPTPSEVRAAIREKGFTTSAGKRRVTSAKEINDATTDAMQDGYGVAGLGLGSYGTRLRGRPYRVQKREPLKTSVSEDDARKLVARHGLKGPLPKTLNREQKMAAYEARYVSAGGKKAEKWDGRARVADKVKTGGLGVATAGGAGWLATRGRLKSKVSSKVVHHAETIAGAGAVAGGSGELYAAHARRKRSSYASAPAGVARGALQRMRDYTP